MLKVILSVIFVLICLALIVIILLQEGKSAGLGSISTKITDKITLSIITHLLIVKHQLV